MLTDDAAVLAVQFQFVMRRAVLVSVAAAALLVCGTASAQDPPPPLPRVVLDLHGIVPIFPNDNQQLAFSRAIDSVTELPGPGLGARVGVHFYLFKWKAITLGIGAEALVGHSNNTPATGATVTLQDGTTVPAVAVSERLSSVDGQLSLNFGSGHGWSYLSGGVGRSQWSLVPSGAASSSADSASLPTTNYGGGAHWSIKRHIGFSLDGRIYEIQPSTPAIIASQLRPGSPRTRLFVVGAGFFLK